MKKYKIQNRSQKNSHSCVPLNAEQDGTFHYNADPDPDSTKIYRLSTAQF